MKLSKRGQEAVNDDLQRRWPNLVRTKFIPSHSQLWKFPHLTHISTAEASREKETARQEAAKRAELRKKRKAIMQEKAARRQLVGGENTRKGTSGFCSVLSVVLTIGTNCQKAQN
jgi:hypothetical protein